MRANILGHGSRPDPSAKNLMLFVRNGYKRAIGRAVESNVIFYLGGMTKQNIDLFMVIYKREKSVSFNKSIFDVALITLAFEL